MNADQVDAILFGTELQQPKSAMSADQSAVPVQHPTSRNRNQRFTQETPILPEVWYEFAAHPTQPDRRVDLLITPYGDYAANRLLVDLAPPERRLPDGARPFALRNFVTVALTFDELIDLVLPRTAWAIDAIKRYNEGQPPFPAIADKPAPEATHGAPVDAASPAAAHRSSSTADKSEAVEIPPATAHESPFETLRIVSLIGAIIADRAATASLSTATPSFTEALMCGFDAMKRIAAGGDTMTQQVAARDKVMKERIAAGDKAAVRPTIWRVAYNRPLDLSDEQARSTVKADAAFRVFDARCSSITWAVIDSGIAQDHPGFNDGGKCRVTRTYDFSKLRDLLDATYAGREKENPQLKLACAAAGVSLTEGTRLLKSVHVATQKTDGLNWAAVEPLIRLKVIPRPVDHHGTHVAGIIGANWRTDEGVPIVVGIAPDINLFDLRILAPDVQQTEEAVISALQFVSYLNRRNDRIAVHGVNLSLSIRHAVKNYACGRTPVCDECEHLVGGGTVVVAAAGNYGYSGSVEQQTATDGYTSARITDPGNADSVITVGATHKREPHTYGICYFSSRGPTGDGRMKPDLVAPGESIRSTLPDDDYGPLDGTSQATPHVSGAAALLMGRFPELIGQPRDIKRLLCDTATDLGRERMYQGHGLLDILRALQSY